MESEGRKELGPVQRGPGPHFRSKKELLLSRLRPDPAAWGLWVIPSLLPWTLDSLGIIRHALLSSQVSTEAHKTRKVFMM